MPDFQLPESFQTFDWFILALRIAFIFLVYYFLYQIARITLRELVTIGTVTSAPGSSPRNMPDPSSALEVIDPAESSYDAGATFPLDHYTTIGRYEDNTIEIDDDFVSGSHAEIFYEQGTWWLQDLGSTNGTFLNTQRVGSRIRISDGDIVQFGRVRVRALL
jgi:pSer/pThr/pTyr-binding forkhead associated (FHA) protein